MSPAGVWAAWSFEPGVVAGIAILAGIYGLGLARLWRSAGVGRGVSRGRAATFGAGLLALVVALVSPLDALGETLFSAHMVQHLLLLVVAAPLLVLGEPLLPLVWALPGPARRGLAARWPGSLAARGASALAAPATAWILASIALWVWHAPGPYRAALEHDAIHALEHASFLGTAALWWWVVLQPVGRRRLDRGSALLYVFTMALESSALGALLTFSGSAWYPIHAAGARLWGMTALEDQQLAGLVMWLPAGLAYLGAMAWLFLTWLAESAGGPIPRARSARSG